MNKIQFEAFAPGKWNGLPFTRKDLEDIASTFSVLEPYHKVPLKFGHSDEGMQNGDGYPALGWVVDAEVNAEGKLMLTAEDVPDLVAKAIKRNLYRKISIELDREVEFKGKNYRYVLSGVALLGADLPAVNTLADLKHYLPADKPALAASRRAVFTAIEVGTTNEDTKVTKEEIEALIKQSVTGAVAPLQVQLTAVTAENERLKSENAKFARDKEDGEKTQKAERVKLARAKLTELMEAAVKQSVITPGQREMFTKNFGINDDERVVQIDAKDFETMIAGGKKIDLGREQGQGGGTRKDERVHENVDDEINRLVNVQIATSGGKLPYRRALDVVLQANPALGVEYIGHQA
jgi:hypothetical protein